MKFKDAKLYWININKDVTCHATLIFETDIYENVVFQELENMQIENVSFVRLGDTVDRKEHERSIMRRRKNIPNLVNRDATLHKKKEKKKVASTIDSLCSPV